MLLLPTDSDLCVDGIYQQEKVLVIIVSSTAYRSACPRCGVISRRVHSHYHRHPRDVPLSGSTAQMDVSVRRFFCDNVACQATTFGERMPELIAPHAHRTMCLAHQQQQVALESGGEGWLYMCAIEDLFSRRIVGWAIRPYLTVDLVRQAFYMACGGRQPEPGVIFHSDRGSQYTSQLFQQELARRGFVPSMSGKGNCFDNAVMESFFHTLKTEEVNLNTYASRKDAVEAVADYIIFYNQVRRHSYLGYLSPMHFEMANVA